MNSIYKLFSIKSFSTKILIFNNIQYREYHRFFSPLLKQLKRRQIIAPPPINHRNTYLEWNYEAELYSFGKRLGEEFDNELLRQALMQRSYLKKLEEEQKRVGIEVSSNENVDNVCMIPKGEEILQNFTLLYLRHILPRFPEEGIQSIKDHLMSEETLSHVCFHIGASELILCEDFPVEKSTLNSTMKALIFALHESSGLERTSVFIRDFILTQIAELDINDLWNIENPIETLNTICRNEDVDLPEPRIVGDSGVNTILALYRVGLYINKKLIGLGSGESIKIAHEMAASDALRRLFGTAEHQLNIPFNLVLNPKIKSEPNLGVKDWCEKRVQERIKQTLSLNE